MSDEIRRPPEVEERRREVERRLADVRTSIDRELGVLPRAKTAVIGLAAVAAGFALALKRKRSKHEKRKRRAGKRKG